MKIPKTQIEGTVWVYEGNAGWYFVTINSKVAQTIVKEYVWPRRGFGAIPVKVTVGKTTWKTSIFPDKEKNYLLPLKKEIRSKENIKRGDTSKISIQLSTI